MDNSLGYATDGYFKTVPLSLFYVQTYKLESDYVFDIWKGLLAITTLQKNTQM